MGDMGFMYAEMTHNMNKKIMRDLGFGKEVDLVEKNLCPICRSPVGKFKDKLSEKEFKISGMCQKCQNKVFG